MCNECQAILDAAHRGLTEACSILLILDTRTTEVSRYAVTFFNEEIQSSVLGCQVSKATSLRARYAGAVDQSCMLMPPAPLRSLFDCLQGLLRCPCCVTGCPQRPQWRRWTGTRMGSRMDRGSQMACLHPCSRQHLMPRSTGMALMVSPATTAPSGWLTQMMLWTRGSKQSAGDFFCRFCLLCPALGLHEAHTCNRNSSQQHLWCVRCAAVLQPAQDLHSPKVYNERDSAGRRL